MAVRLDKWLWAARFFKTRSLAQDAIESGRVLVGGARVKLARPVRIGEAISIRVGDAEREIVVRGLSERRGPAPEAQTLYDETPESIERRERDAAQRRLAPEPAHAIAGRPTKRDRRQLSRAKDWMR
ncbi:MAG TPA: S4 domain-containing protein [Burkholderiaceae bacterium]|nr:S4 domain-containing protein [Burkholderiaceae bacterium]